MTWSGDQPWPYRRRRNRVADGRAGRLLRAADGDHPQHVGTGGRVRHGIRDLGRAPGAVLYANSSLRMSQETFGRSHLVFSTELVDAHLAVGNAEQACNLTLQVS